MVADDPCAGYAANAALTRMKRNDQQVPVAAHLSGHGLSVFELCLQ